MHVCVQSFDSRGDIIIEMLLNVAVYSDFFLAKHWMLTNSANFHCHRYVLLTSCFLCPIPTSLCFVAVDLICVTDVLHKELQGILSILRRQVCDGPAMCAVLCYNYN